MSESMTDTRLAEIRERAERTSRLLRGEQERHKNDKLFAFQTDISMMAADSADCIDAMLDTIDRLTAENARLDEELGRCTSGNGTYISLESHNRILAKLTEKLIAEITDYRAIAADYGIDGKTMLTLAKSQIETAKENAKLTERLKAAVEDWKTAVENANSMLACEACKNRGYHAEDGLYCKVKSCHPVWRGEGSE